MKQAVRAIVVRNDEMLVMHRNKFGNEYYTLIGGGVEMGETVEQALVREVAEETGFKISDARLVAMEEAGPPYGTQYIYLCNSESGEPKMAEDATETQLNELGNVYTPMWLPITKLRDVPFVSEPLKEFLLESFKNGFPSNAVVINNQ